ncbi:MerR family copper efflux transcriptional regulator [Streptacidiphilus sp. MAP12-16]|uniref:MerR family transcriptional regulator n=1 Tax=Streptacidiphilus sp. MAP12-16 TaxID=3156300 RepID=UPI003511CAA3
MRIGELSEQTGASARSIRHYESVGLLKSQRASNGYREFDLGALDQIMKIKLLLQVGLDMTDIVRVLPCMDTPAVARCSHAQRRYDEQIERIERQQRLLTEAKALLIELRTEGAPAESVISGDSIRTVSGNVTVGIR